MRTYRSWIGMALALAVFTALPTGIAYARGGDHFGGEPGHFVGGPGHFVGHPAEHWGHYGPEHWDGRSGWGWHGDVESWHGGHWFHGDHLGRLGWWWVVGDGWYFYPAPVYPYPDPYAVAPSANYWYYCASAGVYYPYVSQCPEGWQPVMPEASQS
jgi:hypothetical protein